MKKITENILAALTAVVLLAAGTAAFATVETLAAPTAAAQQNDKKIAAQRRIIADLEKKIAAEERRIANLKNDKASTQERVQLLTRQIETRNDLLNANERQSQLLKGEINRADSTASRLSTKLEAAKAQYAEMVRESYRNYRHNNYLSYIFSSGDFLDVARRITVLREVAIRRGEKIEEIRFLSMQVAEQLDILSRRQASLDSVKRNLNAQKERLQRDARSAKTTVSKLSKQEKQALQTKIENERRLSAAINELRKLTKGNKAGASFSNRTSNLSLPVVGGTVRKYKGNMAEIIGRKDAAVISVYEGKILDIKRNKINNKYDVYIAHGEYISSYANLSDVCVTKGDKVSKNRKIGTIGSSVNLATMEMEYKLVFGIYAPTPDITLKASDCFRK